MLITAVVPADAFGPGRQRRSSATPRVDPAIARDVEARVQALDDQGADEDEVRRLERRAMDLADRPADASSRDDA
jgi:hypothetical protein